MHKRIKNLIKNLKNVFDVDEINKITKDTKFVQRESSINAKDFLVFNVFHGADICSSSLSQLASKYDVLFATQVSKQALDKRFNKNSVEFMQAIFNQMMLSQNATLKDLENVLNYHFNKVIKGCNFENITQEDLDIAIHKINHRPRKLLGFMTAYEVFWNKINKRCCN